MLSRYKVAFHHSDVSNGDRAKLEQAFRDRRITLLACTSTLAVGVNVNAEYCVVCYNYLVGEQLVPLTHGELEQMAGRAGRRGGVRKCLVLGDATVV